MSRCGFYFAYCFVEKETEIQVKMSRKMTKQSKNWQNTLF